MLEAPKEKRGYIKYVSCSQGRHFPAPVCPPEQSFVLASGRHPGPVGTAVHACHGGLFTFGVRAWRRLEL